MEPSYISQLFTFEGNQVKFNALKIYFFSLAVEKITFIDI
ncbi:hypothetical protein FM107_19450 [Sphingobacterium sp. JB170]|nr:hypothetical protein FM107_19450 [Sphingobacterium sp. JB170]